jgi:integration host factor subunit beta
MTKSELIERLADSHPQFPARDVGDSVNVILNAITQRLREGQRVEARRFGSFAVYCRASRIGRNPKSGDAVQVPEKYVPYFKAGKDLRERVANPA